MRVTHGAAVSFAILAYLGAPGAAFAQRQEISWNGCGYYAFHPPGGAFVGDVELIFGEEEKPPFGSGDGTGKLAYCVRDREGKEYYYTAPYCSDTLVSPAPYFGWKFMVLGNDLDNTVGPTMVSDIVCDDSGPGGVPRRILKWNEEWIFGLYSEAAKGADTTYGTPNEDLLYSYEPWYSGPLPDFDSDTLCGYQRLDELVGDADSSPAVHELLDGGSPDFSSPGDVCDGIGGGDDLYVSCEITYSAGDKGPVNVCGSFSPMTW
jgi:hypothetical protein